MCAAEGGRGGGGGGGGGEEADDPEDVVGDVLIGVSKLFGVLGRAME
jgi:hypothetical protein